MDAPKDSPTEFHLKKPATPFEHLRRHFLAGFLVLVPLMVAFWAALIIMGVTERLFGDIVARVLVAIGVGDDLAKLLRPVISFLIAGVFVLFVGWLSTFFAIKRLIVVGENVITRVPLLKFFYSVPKEVLNTFAASKKGSYKRVVLVEYPRRGLWGIGFATGEMIKKPEEAVLLAVFLPTTPNPTSGFLIYVPIQDVLDTNLSVEEAARLIISGGILAPLEIFSQKFCGLSVQPDLPPLGHITGATEEVIFPPDEAPVPPDALPPSQGDR